MKTITHLTSVKVNGLWGELNIEWKLDPKVNILIGKNGSGKTTLLNLIESTFKDNDFYGVTCSSVGLFFNSQFFFSVERKDAKRLEHSKNHNFFSTETNIFSKESEQKLHSLIKFYKISTFELSLIDLKYAQGYKKPNIKTELDMVLDYLINEFKGYQLKLKNLENQETYLFDKKINKFLSKNPASQLKELEEIKMLLLNKKQKVTEIYSQQNRFIKTINELFSDSNKSIDFDKENAIVFKKNNGEKIITAYQLSSGEKQLLIILLTVILQENKPAILLMDEPEISLHLSWQLQLINILQILNPNCQLIIITHSPGLFSKGWKDKVTQIEDIIKA